MGNLLIGFFMGMAVTYVIARWVYHDAIDKHYEEYHDQ